MSSKKSCPINIPAGQHACLLYGSDTRRIAVLKGSISSALQKNEKVLYIGSDMQFIFRSLSFRGDSGIKKFLKNGQLQVWDTATKDFQLGDLSLLLIIETEKAIAVGRTGMLFTLDISDFLKKGFDPAMITKFETGLNKICKISRCRGLCQYDYRKLPASLIIDAMATHPLIAIGKIMLENPYFMVQPPFFGQDPPDFVLHGFVTQTFTNVGTMHAGILN